MVRFRFQKFYSLIWVVKNIEILERYGFDYKKYGSIEELIFDIEEYLNEEGDSDCGDLDWVSADLSERNYYQNTNK